MEYDKVKIYKLKRKNKANDEMRERNISVFILYHYKDKKSVEKIKKSCLGKRIDFFEMGNSDEGFVDSPNIISKYDYLVVIISEHLLRDTELLKILLANYDSDNANETLIPLIIWNELYEPEKRAEIIKSWQDRSEKYKKDFFDNDFNGYAADEIKVMQKITKMFKRFLAFAVNRDKRNNLSLSNKLIKYIEYNSGEKIKDKDENREENRQINITYNIQDVNQLNIAHDKATISAKQYNGISAKELDSIIQGIMDNLSQLKSEDAKEIKATVDEVIAELAKKEPKASVLNNAVTFLSSMLSIANGVPDLAGNLEKLIEYIRSYI